MLCQVLCCMRQLAHLGPPCCPAGHSTRSAAHSKPSGAACKQPRGRTAGLALGRWLSGPPLGLSRAQGCAAALHDRVAEQRAAVEAPLGRWQCGHALSQLPPPAPSSLPARIRVVWCRFHARRGPQGHFCMHDPSPVPGRSWGNECRSGTGSWGSGQDRRQDRGLFSVGPPKLHYLHMHVLPAPLPQCSLTGAYCVEKNLDGCSCKTCQSGYRPDGAGGCVQVSVLSVCACGHIFLKQTLELADICLVVKSHPSHWSLPPLQCTVDKCATYTSNTCTCTACEANYKLSSGACTEVRCVVPAPCAATQRCGAVGGVSRADLEQACGAQTCQRQTVRGHVCFSLCTNHLPLPSCTSFHCPQCAGSEVANCATLDPNNKCLCSTCFAKHELSTLKNTCTTESLLWCHRVHLGYVALESCLCIWPKGGSVQRGTGAQVHMYAETLPLWNSIAAVHSGKLQGTHTKHVHVHGM